MKTLKELREISHLTQEQVAGTLQISVSYYSLIENGKRKLSAEQTRCLSQLFKVSMEDIFFAYMVCKESTRQIEPIAVLLKSTGTEGR